MVSMSNFTYINGKYLKAPQAALALDNTGFLYGDGLFETLKAANGNVIKFDEHIARLFSSMKELRYNPCFDRELIKSETIKLIEKNKLTDTESVIKIIIARSTYIEKFKFDFLSKPDLIITAKKIKTFDESLYKSGIKIINASIKRNPSGNILYKHKTLNYFENIYCRNEAYAAGADEAFFTTKDRHVLECTSSNIFTVKNNKIFTPPLTQNILPGITRNAVIDICKKNCIFVSERKIHYYNLLEADEVFVTNSLIGLMPVKKIDCYNLKEGTVPGPVTQILSALYSEI